MKSSSSYINVNRAGRRLLCIALVLTAVLALTVTNALATLIAYEPFNYSLGNMTTPASTATGTPTATTGGGFSGAWFNGGGHSSIVSGLTYADLPTTNNAWVPNSSSYDGENLATALTPATYPTLYVSFLFTASAYTTGSVNGFALDNGGGASAGLFFGISSAGKFIIATGDGATSTKFTGPTLTYGQTYLIVVELTKSTAASTFTGAGSVWINPVTGGSQPAATGTFVQFTYASATSINDIITISPGSTTVAIDEIRFGTTWADVTPANATPSSVPMVATPTAGANQVSLSWSDSAGTTTSYNVKRSTTSGAEVTIASVTEPTVTYTDTTTVGGTTYYYEVSAVNPTGESANSSEVSATPTLGAPSAPTGLTPTAGDGQVGLTWTAGFAAAGYNVLRGTSSGGETLIANVTTTSFTDTGLTDGTTYYYEVVSTNTAGNSGPSSEVSATPQPYSGVYEPFNYSSIANGTAVTGTGETGTWTCGATPSIVAGMTYTGLPTANSALSSTAGRQSVNFTSSLARGGPKWISFLFTQLGNNGGNYCGVYFPNGGTGLFFGYGFAPGGSSGAMGLGSMNTVGTGVQGASLLADSFTGTYSTTYLVVMEIQYNTGGGNDTVTVYINPTANAASPGVSATYNVTSFNVGTITGIGLNNQGGGLAVKMDEIRTGSTYGSVVGYNPPTAPTGLAAVPGINMVGLTWNPVSGATGYSILRGLSSGGETFLIGNATTNYTDLTAVGGTTYYYEVEATNTSGVSGPSSEVMTTPVGAPPSMPTGVSAIGTNGAVSLGWNVAAGANSYNVKRSTSSGGESTIVTVGTTNYYDTAVVNGQQYFYEISSTNGNGESANSSEVSATPNSPPLAPTGLVATAGSNQVSLSWMASAGAASYNVKRSTTSGAEVTIASVGTTSYLDTTAIKFTEYYYEVSAVNADGESPNSGETNATPTGVFGPTAYEPFNYPTGAFANNTASTATGFTGNWTIPSGATIGAGLTYAGLSTMNNAYSHTPTGSQNFENLASPLSSGTAYISFLFEGNGNPGAVTTGIFLPGNNANSLFCGFEGGYSTGQTSFGLGSVSTGALGSSTTLGGTTPVNNTGVQLIVLGINFNTSGSNDTVSLWINPPVGVLTPGVPANTVISNFDVGTITGIGINSQGAYALGIDEIRVGQVYGDVVGYVPPPAAPMGLMATPGVNQVALTWDSVSGATGYSLLRGTSSGGETLLTSLPGTNYLDITAVGGTTYYYEVEATNSTGMSMVSSEVFATPTIALPNMPTGVSAIGTNGAVSVTWSVATGASSYNVKRSTTSGAEATIATVSTPSYYDTAVVNGMTYYYEVSSTNNAGESANSSEVSATPNFPPAGPTGLAAVAGSNQVSLSWMGSAGATSYNIKRSTTSGAEVTIDTSATTNYLDTSAVKFTQYFYEVSAVDADGESTNSNEATATPTGVYGPIAYEPFNYPTGGFANHTPSTGTGFTGNWTIPTGASITTGLNYPGLTTADNAYLQTASGFQNYENLASPLSSGTAFISFLFKGAGDPGANPAGIFLLGSNPTSLFAGFEGADNGIDNYFGLGSVSSSTLGGSTILGTTTPISNTNVHLMVLEIDFNTSSTNDTVSLWIDPPVGVTTPGVSANAVVSSYDVGTISGFGYNVAGAYGMIVDEIKIGQVYGDVVGYGSSSPVNPSPTTITNTLAGNQLTLSWAVDHIGWTLQAQTNSLNVGLSTNWYNVPGSTTTNSVTVTIDPTQPSVFYQLEYTVP